MALSSRDRVLYARHLLLAEIGSTGQEQLCATQVEVPAHADPETVAVALDYLARAGVTVRSDAGSPGLHEHHIAGTDVLVPPEPSLRLVALPVADASAVDALAGAPELRHAAEALLGAFVATEMIKRVTGCGTPATFPAQLSFLSEDA